MPPSAFLRELAAAGITLTPEPRARLRFTLLGRTLTFTASPWSVRLGRAEPEITASEPAPPEPVEHDDLIEQIADLGDRWSKPNAVPMVAEGPRLDVVRATGGTPDAQEWGFLEPGQAARRASMAWMEGYGDGLHNLAEEVAVFAAALVAHHLSPNARTASEVRLCGIRAAGQIVAMVKRVSP
jgi:hypothetical protein